MQAPNPENIQLAQVEKQQQQGRRIRLNPIDHLLILIMLDSEAFKIVRENSLRGICVEMLLKLIQDDYDGALSIADKILEKKEIYRVYIFKHNILIRQNKLEEAMKVMEKAYQIKPISRKINYLIGMLFKKQEKYQEAIKYCQNSIQQKPNYWYKNIVKQGLLYQEIQEHNIALVHFTTACDIVPKNKFYIAKMNSFKAQKLYPEALECCQIAILAKPQKSIYYIYKKDLLQLMGNHDEAENLGDQISKIDAFYTLEHFQEKRRLENERALLQKRQSQLRKKPTNSQIITKKHQQAFTEHLDAFYYTFTYFFVSFVEQTENDAQEIAQYLSTKQTINFNKFDTFILHCLRTVFPDIGKMDDRKIQGSLLDWVNLKMTKNENCSMAQYISQLFTVIVNDLALKNLISERLGEDFMKKFEREKKHQDLIILIGCICKEFKNIECSIFDSTAGQLGLEHALLLLGYMIIHSKLAQDKEEDIGTLIWRLFSQKDLNQLFLSQSLLLTKQRQNLQMEKQLNEQLDDEDEKNEGLNFLLNVSKQRTKKK